VLVAFGIVEGIAFLKVERGAGKSFGLMFSRGNFLRIYAVVLLHLRSGCSGVRRYLQVVLFWP